MIGTVSQPVPLAVCAGGLGGSPAPPRGTRATDSTSVSRALCSLTRPSHPSLPSRLGQKCSTPGFTPSPGPAMAPVFSDHSRTMQGLKGKSGRVGVRAQCQSTACLLTEHFKKSHLINQKGREWALFLRELAHLSSSTPFPLRSLLFSLLCLKTAEKRSEDGWRLFFSEVYLLVVKAPVSALMLQTLG